jgi:hypothetical protein
MWAWPWHQVTPCSSTPPFQDLISDTGTNNVRVSIGSLGKNRTTDMVEDVKVDTCLLTNTTNGVRIKSWQVKHLAL